MTVVGALDILKGNYSIRTKYDAFNFILSCGYVYDCETKECQVFRHKWDGHEIHIRKSTINLIESWFDKRETADINEQMQLEWECTNPND